MSDQVANLPPEVLAGMGHADLYNLRARSPEVLQAMIAPYEHRAFAREATAENPFMSLPIALAAPIYQVYKATGLSNSRSGFDPSQIKQAYIGILEGLTGR